MLPAPTFVSSPISASPMYEECGTFAPRPRREFLISTKAPARAPSSSTVPGRRAAVVDDVPDRVGQLELALRVPRVEPVERAPQRRRAEDVGGRVQLPDRALLVRRVPFLDHT